MHTGINCLELLMVLLEVLADDLRQARVDPDGQHSDAYINRQGGLHSHHMSQLASRPLESMRSTHIPGELNRAADAFLR